MTIDALERVAALAPQHPVDPDGLALAFAAFERELAASQRRAPAASPSRRPAPARRPRGRWLALAAATAAVVVATAIVVPAHLNSGAKIDAVDPRALELASRARAGDDSREVAKALAEEGEVDALAQPLAGAPMAPNDTTAASSADLNDQAAMDADREIITKGLVSVLVDDVAEATRQVIDLARSAGGRVENQREVEARRDVPASAQLTLRVPAAAVSATVDGLKELGDVRDVDIEAVDVTATAHDLDARIAAYKASTARLQTLMGQADSVADLLEAERELTARQAELDGLQAARNALKDQVAMSTLSVVIGEKTVDPKPTPGGFLGGLRAGWQGLLTATSGVVIAIGALVPWLIPAAIAGAIVAAIRRHRRRSAQTGPR